MLSLFHRYSKTSKAKPENIDFILMYWFNYDNDSYLHSKKRPGSTPQARSNYLRNPGRPPKPTEFPTGRLENIRFARTARRSETRAGRWYRRRVWRLAPLSIPSVGSDSRDLLALQFIRNDTCRFFISSLGQRPVEIKDTLVTFTGQSPNPNPFARLEADPVRGDTDDEYSTKLVATPKPRTWSDLQATDTVHLDSSQVWELYLPKAFRRRCLSRYLSVIQRDDGTFDQKLTFQAWSPKDNGPEIRYEHDPQWQVGCRPCVGCRLGDPCSCGATKPHRRGCP
ncbi:MAG: hypothetical protein AAGF23_27300 [Acidobacteriota bacterium]